MYRFKPPVGTANEELEEKEFFAEEREPSISELSKREDALMFSIKYFMEPVIPEEYKAEFDKYALMFSQIMTLSNLPDRKTVYRYITFFDVIYLWMKCGKPEVAIQRMARMLMELQLMRSIRGFERLAHITHRVVQQPPSEEETQPKKKERFWGLFG